MKLPVTPATGLTIYAGQYQVRENLSLHITDDLSLDPGSTTLITGSNGAGKSTFFHKLLIPEIAKHTNNVILLMEQDFEIQFYALAARSVDIKKKQRGVHTPKAALEYVKTTYLAELQPHQQLFILLDEPTRYLNPAEWVAQFSQCNPIVCMITHDTTVLAQGLHDVAISSKPCEKVIHGDTAISDVSGNPRNKHHHILQFASQGGGITKVAELNVETAEGSVSAELPTTAQTYPQNPPQKENPQSSEVSHD